MIDNIVDYINLYVNGFPANDLPGEHHFVASYLVPKIYKVVNKIPCYINPDGMKMKPGDIIYEKNFAIEVKFLKINLTKTQYSEWVVKKNIKPDYLVALGRRFICIIQWPIFLQYYKSYLLKKNKFFKPYKSGYTPLVNTDIIAGSCILNEECFDIHEQNIEHKIEKKLKKIFAVL